MADIDDSKGTHEHVELSHGKEHDDKAYNHEMGLAAEATLAEARGTWSTLKANPKMCCVLGAALLNGVIVGIETNMSGNFLGLSAFVRTMGEYDATTQAYAVAAPVITGWQGIGAVAMLSGMWSNGVIGDRFGRRPVLWAVILLNIIGAIVESISNSWRIWCVAKAIMGVGTGMMLAGVSTYIGDIAPRELRGIFLAGFQLLFNAGNLLSILISYAGQQKYPSDTEKLQFRMPCYIMIALPVLIAFFYCFFLVESPTWLIKQGRFEQSRKNLRFLYPTVSEEELELEFATIQYTLEKEAAIQEESRHVRWTECFRGIDLRRTFVAMFPGMLQPLVGNILYGPLATYFFSQIGESNALISSGIVQGCSLAANAVIIFVINSPRVGRFPILFVGTILMTFGMILTGVMGSIPATQTTGKVVVAAITIGNVGSIVGPGATGFIYAVEAGSARLRAKTVTLGNFGNALLMNASGLYISYLISTTEYAKWGEKTGYFFGSFGVVGLVVLWFCIPDFTGRSSAQIDEMFSRDVPARRFKSYECTGDYGRAVLAPGVTTEAYDTSGLA